jgi:hypothetical protein
MRSVLGKEPQLYLLCVIRKKLIQGFSTKHCYRKVVTRTLDPEMLVLDIAAVQQLSISELSVGLPEAKASYTYQLPTHEIARTLGPEKCV